MTPSRDAIRAIRAALDAQADVADPCHDVLAQHLTVADASHDDALPLVRTLDEFPPKPAPRWMPTYEFMASCPVVQSMALGNCHHGQRKLTLALLEFIADSLVALDCDDRDVVLLYVGASGLATVAALTVFPSLQAVIYDPAKNTTELMPRFDDKVVYVDGGVPCRKVRMDRRLVVFTQRAGWFDDTVAAHFRAHLFPRTGRKHLLFVSDVRAQTSEDAIARDMVDQQRWTIVVRPARYMLKFRMPYVWTHAEREIVHGLYVASAAALLAHAILVRSLLPAGWSLCRDSIPYLDGRAHLQLYGRQRTAELRLVGSVVGGRYAIRSYDMRAIEDAMATFNNVYRTHARFRVCPCMPASRYEHASEIKILSTCIHAATPSRRRRRLPDDCGTCECRDLGARAAKLREAIDSLVHWGRPTHV